MIYNLFGENSFLLSLELKKQKSLFEKQGFDIFFIDFDLPENETKTPAEFFNQKLAKLKTALDSYNLFNNNKAVFVKNFNEKILPKPVLKKIMPSFERASEDKNSFLIFTSKTKQTLSKNTKIKFLEFKKSSPKEIDSFIKETAKQNNLTLSLKAIDFLKNNFTNNLEAIYFEIQKLSNYKQTIDEKDILALISKPNVSIDFAITNAFSTLNKVFCFKTLLNEINANTFDLLIFGSTISYLRNALLLKEKQLIKSSVFKIHPFVEKKMTPFINKFSDKELKLFYGQLYQYDLLIKKGRVDTSLCLKLFITKNI